MADADLCVVTGAFSFTGKYIARRLLAEGKRVRTLTGHPTALDPLSEQVASAPYNFERPDLLTESLRGASTVFSTYWVRFSRGTATNDRADANIRTLVQCA